MPRAVSARPRAGDEWTRTALRAVTKLVLSCCVGDRSATTTIDLMDDLQSRLDHRVQLTTDGLKAYLDAVEGAFGGDIDVQPASVLRRVADLESSGEARLLLRFEGIVKRRQPVRVQVVHHQHDPFAGKVDVGKVLQDPGEVPPRAAVGDLDMAPSVERGIEHEQVRRPVALALIVEVEPGRPARTRRQRRARLLRLPLRRLVRADQRGPVVMIPAVDAERVLHGADEVRVRLRRNAPAFLQPRLQTVFFSVRLTVSLEMLSTAPSSTSLSPSSLRLHPAWPGGGSEQASIASFASPAPSSRRFFRFA